jgi:hypothetical protein
MATRFNEMGGTNYSGETVTDNDLNDTFNLMARTIRDTLRAENGDSVISGLVVSEQSIPDQSVQVSSGKALIDGLSYSISENLNLSLSTADVTNPRYDIISVDASGVFTVTDGTASATPVMPTKPSDSVVVAYVYRAANDNVIGTADITDCRALIGKKYYSVNNTRTVSSSGIPTNMKSITIPAFKLRNNCTIKFDFGGYLLDSGKPGSSSSYITKISVNGTSVYNITRYIAFPTFSTDEEALTIESGATSVLLNLSSFNSEQIINVIYTSANLSYDSGRYNITNNLLEIKEL